MRTESRGAAWRLTTLATCFVLSLATGGCASLGPAAIRWERTDYNVAIQETQNEQLLLNLVRLRYSEDSDLSSKATFSLLSHLLALQSGEIQRLVPVLTLPVGR